MANLKVIGTICLSGMVLIGATLAVMNQRKAAANNRQLVGTWKVISGGRGGAETIEMREDGTLTSSTRSFGKERTFDGTYKASSGKVTMTVLADQRWERDWNADWNADANADTGKQPGDQAATSTAEERKTNAGTSDESPEVEDVVMTILSLTDKELVIANPKGRRTIYGRQ